MAKKKARPLADLTTLELGYLSYLLDKDSFKVWKMFHDATGDAAVELKEKTDFIDELMPKLGFIKTGTVERGRYRRPDWTAARFVRK